MTPPTTSPPPPTPPTLTATSPSGTQARAWVGDCREQLPRIPEVASSSIDLVFADPPFNWNRDYNKHTTPNSEDNRVWDDKAMSSDEYTRFTYDWLDLCINALKPSGSIWVNIPDDWAAEIVVHLKTRGLHMVNWCIWHYRFGQNTRSRFINSKVHALYFCKDPDLRTWNPDPVLELSDRRTVYADPRTESKRDGLPAGHRVPMDVWYGQYWGRIQGNNKERRAQHDNQLPEVYLHRVIASTSNEHDTVLDPFLGSGTTAVVATAMNRNFVGTEYSIDNARAAMQRVEMGPIRDLTSARGLSTAIHEPRRAPQTTPPES
jgi:DNA modification methylase